MEKRTVRPSSLPARLMPAQHPGQLQLTSLTCVARIWSTFFLAWMAT